MTVTDARDAAPAGVEDLRRDYEQTMAVWRMLVDTRFKLLAFVPPITAAIGALAGQHPSASSAMVAAAALAALFGIVGYDLRNTAFHDAAVHRARELERRLGMPHLSDKGRHGGLMSERPVSGPGGASPRDAPRGRRRRSRLADAAARCARGPRRRRSGRTR